MRGRLTGDRGPPRLAEALLSLVVRDAEAREGILGDLREEYSETAHAHSPGHAARWYWWCALRLGARYAVQGTPSRRRGAGPVLSPSQGSGGWDFVRDLGYALRGLRRNRGFTLALTLTLGLGIGASATIFAVFNAVVLRPIPFPDPDRLVGLSALTPRGVDFHLSEPDFLDIRDGSAGSLDLAAVREDAVTFLGEDGMEARVAAFTTSALFRVLGVSPTLGRTFTPREGRLGTEARVVILGNGMWAGSFGSDPEVVGRTLRIDEGLFVVVGVMPRALEVLGGVDFWLARPPDRGAPREDHRLQVFGRLRPDVTLADARAAVGRVALELSEAYPATNRGWGVRLIPLTESLVGPQVRLITVTLLSAVGLLLLLIGANLSNLLMARTTVRRREFGVLCAMGAGRGGVLRLLLAESLIVGVGAAVIGVAVAFVLIPFVARQPELVPRMSEVALDGRVLWFAALAAAAEALAIGFASALPAARWRIRRALTETGEGATRSAQRTRDLLAVGQLSLAMTLLVAAGLLGKSFQQLQGVEPGFRTDGLMAVEVQLSKRHAPHELSARFEDVLAAIRGMTGVGAAAGTDMRYFDLSPRNFTEMGRMDATTEDYVTADWRVVTEGYFHTSGVPLRAGRVFDDGQRSASEGQVVLGETLAASLWPGEDAVGRQVRWDGPAGPVTRVIGVVGDVSDVHPVLPQVASAYVRYRDVPRRSMTLLVRAESPPPDFAASVRRQVRNIDPDATLSELRAVEEKYADVVALDRFLPSFMAVVAAVAVLLAGLGVYGLLAFSVAGREHEIGIRLALGGHPRSIVRMLFRRGAVLVTTGVVVGAGASFALSKILEEILSALLFETAPTDLVTYLSVGAFLTVVGLTATYVPSRRATEVDPLKVLPA